MEEGSVAKVLNDFLTVSDGEISLKKGDIAQVLEKVDRHWWYGCCGGKYGKFPAGHLIAVEVSPLEDSHELFAAIADFPRQQDGDLGFSRGDLIVGISQVNEDWWFGKTDVTTGIFPLTYTWQLDSKPLKAKNKQQHLNKRARVKMNMKAQLEEEMDLCVGEIVIVKEIIDKNWYRGVCGSREGVFPSAYVELLDDDDDPNAVPSVQSTSRTTTNSKSNSDVDSLLALSPQAQYPPAVDVNDNTVSSNSDIFDDDYFKVNMPSIYRTSTTFNGTSEPEATVNPQPLVELDVVPYGITLYPFYAQFDNELSFHEGEIVTLCRHIDKDWIEGKIDGKKGIFPKSYVNILVDCDAFSNFGESSQDHEIETELAPNLFAKVLYNFDAQMTGDLTVHKDEVVWIVSKTNEDWCEVRNQSGKTGLCPQNYLSPHLCPQDTKSRFTRGTSLATDDLLGLFSSEENAVTPGYSQNVTSDLHKKKCESMDLSQTGIHIPQNKNSIDNFSKNLNSYNTNFRHSIDLSDRQNETKTVKHEQSPAPCLEVRQAPSPLPSLPIQDTGQCPSNEQDFELRHPEGKRVQPHFQRTDLKRQSSDRLPHRPAPPVPVPGHKPVRRSLRRVPARSSSSPERIIEETTSAEDEAAGAQCLPEKHSLVSDDLRKKNAEQRQNVISELVYTEKEYVRDLKVTYETFNLHNPAILEARGIDVKVVFGNILEVMHLAEELLDKMQLAMKGKDECDQCVGRCFIELADQMKSVYGQYCMNHNNALILLEKYETVEEIQSLFDKGIETLRYQIACFDMGSILIKPVQRILKYPLILNELIKCTEDSHKDKPDLLKAVKTMMDVAAYINEYKRRQDIVSKYLGDANTTMSEKMSRLSLHSVAKKSSRLGVLLTSTLFGASTKDPVFDEHEFMFHSIVKTVRSFVKDVEGFLSGMQEQFSSQLQISSSMVNFYQDRKSEVEDYHRLQQLICKRFLEEFKTVVERKVLAPLNTLMELFEGPAILIQKRHDKLLDYDGCYAKAEKNKENRLIQEELMATKSNYEALNSHLVEELPTLNKLARELLVESLAVFITARKMLSGKITKEYLRLMEMPVIKSYQGDPVETFSVKHSLVWNQLARFNFGSKGGKTDTLTTKDTSSPTLTPEQRREPPSPRVSKSQSPSQQAYLQNRYARDMLYSTIQPYRATEDLELSIDKGLVVGVIKKHDPLGSARRWFVDDGTTKGFIPSNYLEPVYQNINSTSPVNVPSKQPSPKLESMSRPLPQPARPASLNQPPRPASVNQPARPASVNQPPRPASVNQPPRPALVNQPARPASVNQQPARPANIKLLPSQQSDIVPPPPSYDEVVSTPESNAYSTRPSSHRYEQIDDDADGNIYEQIPDTSVYENIPSETSSSPSNPGFYYAAYDFEGTGMNMLSLKIGQVVLVLQQQDTQGNPEWWLVEDRSGNKGYVPGNYLSKYQQ